VPTDDTQRSVVFGVAYDGAPWSGLVVQNNAKTVGGALLAAIQRVDPAVSKLRVASRTDAGVHARDNRVAFDTAKDIPSRGWVLGVRQHLPPSVAVRWAARACRGFNPRFETTAKHYRYLVLCDPLDDPFYAGRAWRVHDFDPAQHDSMASELEAALGQHDFTAFASARDEREHRVRTLTEVGVQRLDSRLLAIDIRGDGFLHNMVRILVGTVVDVARGKRPRGTIVAALKAQDRTVAGVTAPPCGLYLERLWMRDDGEDRWPAAD